MQTWFSSTCRAFIFTALVCFFIGAFANQKIAANAYIAGHGITLLAFLLLLTNAFFVMFRNGTSMATMLYDSLLSIGPFIFIITITSLVLYNMFKYRINIENEHIGGDYIWYSESIVFLAMLQLFVMFSELRNDNFEMKGTVSKLSSSLLYLFAILSLMSYITLHSILNSYTTDGFTNGLY
jgi:hypothetical protein